MNMINSVFYHELHELHEPVAPWQSRGESKGLCYDFVKFA